MSNPAIVGPNFTFIRNNELGLAGTLNRTNGKNTLGEASFHVPTLSLAISDPQIVAGKVRVPAGYTAATFQLQKYEFDITIVNDGEPGVIPTPAERPEIWEVWPGTETLVLRDFWYVDFIQNGNLVIRTTRPAIVSPLALIVNNSAIKVSRDWNGAAGQWTQISDIPDGLYEVNISVNPVLANSVPLVFGLDKRNNDVIVFDDAPARNIVITKFNRT